jgi:hypothetical protein
MTAYSLLRLLHALAAVLGAGTITGIAVLTRSTPLSTLRPLSRLMGASFGILLLTAIAMDAASGGTWATRSSTRRD